MNLTVLVTMLVVLNFALANERMEEYIIKNPAPQTHKAKEQLIDRSQIDNNRTRSFDVVLTSTLKGHGGSVTSLDIRPNSKSIVSASKDKLIIVWEKVSGIKKTIFKGHKDSILCVRYHPDGNKILSSSKDKSLILWDAKHGKIIQKYQNYLLVYSFAFNRNGKSFITCGNKLMHTDKKDQLYNGVIGEWNTDSKYQQSNTVEHFRQINVIVFSPDGKSYSYVSGSSDALSIRLTGPPNINNLNIYALDLASRTSPLLCLAYSPDGKNIATGDQGGNIILWNIKPFKIATILKGHKGAVTSLSFSPDGKLLLTGSKDKTVRLWDLSTKKNIITKTEHTGEVLTVKFSPNGKFFTSGSTDKTVKVWSIKRIDKKKKK